MALEGGDEVEFDLSVSGIVDKIVHLPGVALEIEDLEAIELRIEDELVLLRADGALDRVEPAEHGVVQGRGLFGAEHGDERGELDVRRDCYAGEIAGSGVHGVLIDHLVDALAGLDAGAGDEQRHTHGALVLVLLAHEAVLADGEAVVCGEDDVGVAGLAGGLESVEDAADLGVHVRDDGVVLAAVGADGVFGAREGREDLVAGLVLALIEGMLGEEVGRDSDLVGRVEVEVLLRCLTGVVRGVEAYVHEERVRFGGDLPGEVVDGGVGVEGAGVLDGLVLAVEPDALLEPVAEELPVGGVPVVAGGGAVVHVGRRREVAGGYGALLGEGALEGDGVKVPLAGDEGVVAGLAEGLAPAGFVAGLVGCVGLFGTEGREAGVEHGATGDADGSGPGALMEAVGEVGSGADEAVEVWGVDLGVVDGIDGAEHEVVRDEEEEVGPGGWIAEGEGRPSLDGGECSGGQSDKLASIHGCSQFVVRMRMDLVEECLGERHSGGTQAPGVAGEADVGEGEGGWLDAAQGVMGWDLQDVGEGGAYDRGVGDGDDVAGGAVRLDPVAYALDLAKEGLALMGTGGWVDQPGCEAVGVFGLEGVEGDAAPQGVVALAQVWRFHCMEAER